MGSQVKKPQISEWAALQENTRPGSSSADGQFAHSSLASTQPSRRRTSNSSSGPVSAAPASIQLSAHATRPHSKPLTHKDFPAAAMPGTGPRHSLSQISMNLPEAPGPFRHVPLTSDTSQRSDTDRLRPHGGLMHPAADAAATAYSAQSSKPMFTSSQMHSPSASLLLPASPRRKSTTAQHDAKIDHQCSQNGLKGCTSTGVIGPTSADASAGAVGLFADALLDGPPRLAQAASSIGPVSQAAAEADAADVRNDASSCTEDRTGSRYDGLAGNAVKLPLRHSDFSK